MDDQSTFIKAMTMQLKVKGKMVNFKREHITKNKL